MASAIEKDFYYIDMFNSVPTSTELETSKHGLESTVRLYTTVGQGDNARLDKCLLVAPYIDPVSFSGTNMWTQGGGSVVDIMTDTATQMVKSFNEAVWDLKNDLNTTKQSIPISPWLAGIRGTLLAGAEKVSENLPSMDYQTFNLGQFKRAFGGTTIACPISNISTVLFSNPKSDDFNWFSSSMKKKDKPLRYICAALMLYLLGSMSPLAKKIMGESADQELAAVQYAPNGINARNLTSYDSVIENSFALIVGSGSGDDNEYRAVYENAEADMAVKKDENGNITTNHVKYKKLSSQGKSIKGAPKIIWNVLPTQLTISPSRLLTSTDDYYYVKIDIGFEMASYLDTETIASNWISDTESTKKIQGDASPKIKGEETS